MPELARGGFMPLFRMVSDLRHIPARYRPAREVASGPARARAARCKNQVPPCSLVHRSKTPLPSCCFWPHSFLPPVLPRSTRTAPSLSSAPRTSRFSRSPTRARAGSQPTRPIHKRPSRPHFPAFAPRVSSPQPEDRTEWAIGAFNSDGFQVLQIFKRSNGKVREVHGVTHHLEGPNGERIGMTFSEIGRRAATAETGATCGAAWPSAKRAAPAT